MNREIMDILDQEDILWILSKSTFLDYESQYSIIHNEAKIVFFRFGEAWIQVSPFVTQKWMEENDYCKFAFMWNRDEKAVFIALLTFPGF